MEDVNVPPGVPPPDGSSRILLLIIVALMLLLGSMLHGCTSFRKAAKVFDAEPIKSAKYCGDKYPVRERRITKIVTKAGKPDTVLQPGETVYMDCDSVVVATLDEASRRRVPCPCPPTRIINTRDSILVHDSVLVENTAKVAALQGENNKLSVKLEVSEKKLNRRTLVMWGAIGVAAVLALIVGLGVTGKLSRII